jgi:hypothetical protein
MSKQALLAAVEPRITIPENKTEGILSWDVDNNYPARMRNILANSVTAVNCLKTYIRFVFGRGLSDQDFAETAINESGETVSRLLRRAVENKGFINGVAIHLNYNGVYEKVEATLIPIETVRLSIDKKKVAVHPNWEKRKDKKRFQKSDIEFFDLYDPSPEAIDSQVKEAGGIENYKGQVFFWSPNGVEYPVAEWDASAEDLQTEGGTKIFRNRTVGQNFMPSQYIVVDDVESNDEETDGNPSKVDESFADIIVGTVRQFQAPENAGSVMVIQKPSPDTTFEMHVPDLQHFDGMYEKTEKSTESAILRAWMMPRPLILEGGDSLFSSGEVLNAAAEFYNNVTEFDRIELKDILTEVFSGWEFDICPSGDFSILPIVVKKKITAEYFPMFTTNEIRESLGASAVEDKEAETKMLAETIGVSGTTSLISIVTDTAMTIDAKKGTLKTLFNFTEEQVNEVLGLNNTQAK